VKRSGRDEPMWVAIHMCMKAMLSISLYHYLYLKLAKTLCLYYLLCLLFNKRTRGQSKFSLEGEGEVTQTMYTNVSKCKNDKIKKKKKKHIIDYLTTRDLCQCMLDTMRKNQDFSSLCCNMKINLCPFTSWHFA
jgi:hypothetical protein